MMQFNGISSINITQKVLGKAYGESSSSSFPVPFRLGIFVAAKTVGSFYSIYTFGILYLSTEIFTTLTRNSLNGFDPTFRI